MRDVRQAKTRRARKLPRVPFQTLLRLFIISLPDAFEHIGLEFIW
jgi:hypothetical protein